MTENFTFGIEEEYFLVDATTKRVTRRMPEAFLAAARKATDNHVAGEFLQSQIEVFSCVHSTMADARNEMRRLRQAVAAVAAEHGLAGTRLEDLVLAVNELATNTIRYGGGEGTVCIWREDQSVLCEVTDAGRITDPMIGRFPPPVASEGGRGLWLVNQLCDLAQVRTIPAGTVIRLHMRVD